MSEDLKITIDNDGSVHYNNDYVGCLSKSGIFNYRNECPEEVINYFLDKDYIVKKHISEATKSSDEKLDERSVSQKKNDVMFFVIKKVSDNTYFVLDDGDMSWSKDINDAESYDDKSDAEDALDFEIMEYVSVPQSITDEADILDYKDTIRETYFNIVPVYANEFHESKKLKEELDSDWRASYNDIHNVPVVATNFPTAGEKTVFPSSEEAAIVMLKNGLARKNKDTDFDVSNDSTNGVDYNIFCAAMGREHFHRGVNPLRNRAYKNSDGENIVWDFENYRELSPESMAAYMEVHNIDPKDIVPEDCVKYVKVLTSENKKEFLKAVKEVKRQRELKNMNSAFPLYKFPAPWSPEGEIVIPYDITEMTKLINNLRNQSESAKIKWTDAFKYIYSIYLLQNKNILIPKKLDVKDYHRYTENEKSLKESKQKDIIVDFEIPVNPRGRIRSTDAKKLLKHLLNTKQLKVGKEYFVTDVNNNMTLWSLSKDDFSGYRFDCEITETPEGREVDVYHCLRFEKRNGRLTDFDWEANNVY